MHNIQLGTLSTVKCMVLGYVAWTWVQVSGAGVNLGGGYLKFINPGYVDMDPNLDTGTGIRYTIVFRKYSS